MDIKITETGRVSNPLLKRVKVVRGDICAQEVDAIATLIPADLEYRGELNLAILAAAGESLDEFVVENIYQPKAGDIYAVPGFDLAAKHILFCVRPEWKQGFERSSKDLLVCGRKIMTLAKCMLLESIAIPLIGSGHSGFSDEKAARLLVRSVEERLCESLKEVRLVAFDYETEGLFRTALEKLGWEG